MNPFNNNTLNLSQSELLKKKRLQTINDYYVKDDNNTKLKMGSSSISNVYDKNFTNLLKTWNPKFDDISGNSLFCNNEDLLRDPAYHSSFIEINFNKKALKNKC